LAQLGFDRSSCSLIAMTALALHAAAQQSTGGMVARNLT
jgi:hypothetical protein